MRRYFDRCMPRSLHSTGMEGVRASARPGDASNDSWGELSTSFGSGPTRYGNMTRWLRVVPSGGKRPHTSTTSRPASRMRRVDQAISSSCTAVVTAEVCWYTFIGALLREGGRTSRAVETEVEPHTQVDRGGGGEVDLAGV